MQDNEELERAHLFLIMSRYMVKTRMAPSPTGEYHIGHMRTILYNVALAKKHHGKFVLRIEDTDRTRFIPDAIDRILDVIRDYGFHWDEGPRIGGEFGPYIQSERLPIYKKYGLELVNKKIAYYCFCTPDRLAKMREVQKAQKIASPKYDKRCLHLSREEIKKNLEEKLPYVIRLNVLPDKIVSFDDIVFGKITVNSNDIDDQILLKSDGFPTYHLAVVIDDHLMEITHVMRGNDWIPSTPKHILLYEAFGWKVPIFIHLPNLKELGATQKLSKRYGPVSAREFLEAGYLPEAIINFLMFLGWNPGTTQEIYTFDEFVNSFDPKKIHKTDLVSFDRQKLTWMNQQYIQNLPDGKLKQRIIAFYPRAGLLPDRLFDDLLPLLKTRMQTLKDFEILTSVFFEGAKPQRNKQEQIIAAELRDAYKLLSSWQEETVFAVMKETLSRHHERMPLLYRILTGRDRGLPLPKVVELLGKQRTLELLR